MIGKKFDQGKLDWLLMPWPQLRQVAKVMEFGAAKYAPDAWQHVENGRRRYLSAAFRHITALVEGEAYDQESGLHHAAHCICCLLFIIWFDDTD